MLSYVENKNLNISTLVAVPVNYGMLSYYLGFVSPYFQYGRSPRQLWNALLRTLSACHHALHTSQSPSIMECSPTCWAGSGVRVNWSQSPSIMECSPTKLSRNLKRSILSQSPSIMECSPTLRGCFGFNEFEVAVPVNYGMLSYRCGTR